MDKDYVGEEKMVKEMSSQEEDLIHRLHRLVGDRWEIIAGRLQNRRAEEVEEYWSIMEEKRRKEVEIIKPIAFRISSSFKFTMNSVDQETDH
ncbi:MYB-like transcription factor ETC1 [Dioscorea cayenensis subsp. rotundata]|uniref:MYB-like transcription factor ETC1 n=1 Tax=Dioscorea cayennensis subsp. rotundata TaxID=55577 RepID=A0AB40C237_DIOCR|nr:MYB-like transcription factor ETC1 [Dioscorea cayenensis subsp. rotundata]